MNLLLIDLLINLLILRATHLTIIFSFKIFPYKILENYILYINLFLIKEYLNINLLIFFISIKY